MKFRKVAGVVALHYGREYLGYSIRSVINDLDELHVLYSPEGSHSVRTTARCPETRDELFTIAHASAGDKLHWHDGDWRFEGQQRDSIFNYTDADVLVTVDADEWWKPGLLRAVLRYGEYTTKSDLRIPMWHYWRSLRRVVKDDPAYPVRVRFLPLQKGDTTFQRPPWSAEDFLIHHMGYAQSTPIVEYKPKVHGHIAEWRADWFETRWLPNAQTDCHPTMFNRWNPIACEPPDFMREHPYYSLEVIP